MNTRQPFLALLAASLFVSVSPLLAQHGRGGGHGGGGMASANGNAGGEVRGMDRAEMRVHNPNALGRLETNESRKTGDEARDNDRREHRSGWWHHRKARNKAERREEKREHRADRKHRKDKDHGKDKDRDNDKH
mgnify:CR=1 FL=1